MTFYEKPKVIQETLTIPDTKAIGTVFGRTPSTEHYAVPLAPVTEGDKVIVENAILTLKGELIATGISQISSKQVIDSEKGIAVKLERVFMEPKS